MFSGVVEFIFGHSQRIIYGDEGQFGLEIGRDKKSGEIIAFMSLDFPEIYHLTRANVLKDKEAIN